MRSVARDLIAAARSFRRSPAFALAVLLTLGLGIAPNCAIFAIVNAVYLRPLPYPEQHRLALLNVSRPSQGVIGEVDPFTFQAWQAAATSVESMALYRNGRFNVNVGDRPEQLPGQFVTSGFFRTVGVEPAIGRAFRLEDGLPGAAQVVVISHRTWRDYFGGRSDILGVTLRVNGVASTVIGVMGPGFTSFMEGRTARIWVPMPVSAATGPAEARGGNALARLKAGTTVAGAAGELASIQSGLVERFPDFYRDRRALVRDFRSALFGGLGPGLRMLSVIVGLLLLIACGNAANLLLGRSALHTRETAVRSALGASRFALVRAALAESLLLAFAAGVLGLVLAFWGVRLLWASSAPMFVVIGVDGIEFDRQVVAFAFALAAVTTLLFGGWPALRGSRLDIVEVLKDGAAGAGGRGRGGRMSRALVIAQVALCVVTMIGTVLMLRSVGHFAAVSANPGFRAESLLVASLPAPDGADPARRRALLEEAERRVAAVPGVDAVAVADRLPFLAAGAPVVLLRPGATDEATGERLTAEARVVDADFFPVLSVPVLRGRAFTADDTAGHQPVIVISDRVAAAWPKGSDPLGDRVRVDGTWRTIVGIVGSTIEPSPFRPSAREVFLPYLQSAQGGLSLLVRSRRPIASLAPAIRRQVRAVDADQPVADLQTMPEALHQFMAPFRLILVLIAVFGSIALGLAAMGLYAVIAQGVSRRLREIGIRLALGARRPAVVAMVVREGLRLATAGLAVGLLAGLAVARILPSEILGVRGLSAGHYAATALLWLSVAVLACAMPARSAARVDPVAALRRD